MTDPAQTPAAPSRPPPATSGHTIQALDHAGHGIATLADGLRIRIPGVDVGERVHLGPPIEAGRRRWARLTGIETPSPHRIDPDCAQAAACPGCPLRHLSAARQGELRLASHTATLRRLAGLKLPAEYLPAVGPDGYRARAIARPYLDPAGTLRLGLRPLPGHPQPGIDLAACPAQTEPVRALLDQLAAELAALAILPFDPDHNPGGLRHVVVQAGDPPSGLVILGFGAPPDRERLSRGLLADRPDIGLHLEIIAPHKHGVLVDPTPLRGPDHLELTVDGQRLRGTLPAWLPQTPGSVPTLRQLLLDWLAPTQAEHLVEIGCGVGTLSLPLAHRVGRLTGIDQIRAATLDAQHNAAHAQLSHKTHFRVGRADKTLRRLLAGGERADLVILHGMRRPYGPAVLAGVRALRPRAVILISPSAAAIARDLTAASPGLIPRRIALLDQLPGTAWLLTVALLTPPEA